MDMMSIYVTGPIYFAVSAPCGESWQGMRHSDDVRIILDRAMDHPGNCGRCAALRVAVAAPNGLGRS